MPPAIRPLPSQPLVGPSGRPQDEHSEEDEVGPSLLAVIEVSVGNDLLLGVRIGMFTGVKKAVFGPVCVVRFSTNMLNSIWGSTLCLEHPRTLKAKK